ncbi:MAG: hypothetical protein ISS48_00455 [Candidatus Aenigmarchaeota archaeon]|nr:hypothetical protein [Candidatus Aenigmarchaeota archaeon]
MRIKIDSILIQKYGNKKPIEMPNEIYMNKEVSWMIGFWVGDNWSGREGSVIIKNKKSSGRFGVVNNDKENIKKFLEGLKNEFGIKNIKLDIQIPRHKELEKERYKERNSKIFGIYKENINVYFGSSWRKRIGYIIYTNNTVLLRIITNEIYKNLLVLVKNDSFDNNNLLSGIIDSEGTVDKANKVVSITNKDKFVVKIIELCLQKLKINYSKRFDRDRIRIDIKEIKKIRNNIYLNTLRKQKEIIEMVNGNYTRKKDITYLRKFYEQLKEGMTAKQISEKNNIPHSTVKLVLRNLFSGKHIEREIISNRYVYYNPRVCLTKREVDPKKR